MGAERNRSGNVTSRWMTGIHIVFLIIAVLIVGKIICIQFFWQPTPMEEKFFGTRENVDTLYPLRGTIMDTKGRLLASSVPMYQVTMDCTVRKSEFESDNKNGRTKEAEWRSKAKQLAYGLVDIYGGNADEWYRRIISNRDHNRSYMRIGGQIDHSTLLEVKRLPLFCEGAFRGGIGIEVEETRKYPYGSLGRRAIGVVKNNRDTKHITGIEEKCNDKLHGKEGVTVLKHSDVKGVYVPGNNWKSKKPVDGVDVRTTLDIDIQDIADKALRDVLEQNIHMIGGCCIVMETTTGAIRAMANLKRDNDGKLGEIYNYALTTAQNPGSVFKTATLMAALDENRIELGDSVPCMNGYYVYKGVRCPLDKHATKTYYPSGYIRVDEGLKISSNHVFRYIGGECFGKDKKDVDKYIKLLESYHLFDNEMDFDINGLASCRVKNPNTSNEALTLPMVAMGYDMETTPLHILTFYNAIANGGREMKPYMIESYEKDGRTVEKFSPKALSNSICRKATADSLTSALLKITQEEHGTAYWRMRGAKCKIAGKTGTAFQVFRNPATGKSGFGDSSTGRVIQGSFAGFFPAEDPKYTAICVFYTDITHDNLEGSRCASAVRTIADELYCMHPEWADPITKSTRMPKADAVDVITGKNNDGKVPDVVGLGLSDAVYSIESCGYKCSYEGSGEVKSQSPAAYQELKKGSTVVIRLK